MKRLISAVIIAAAALCVPAWAQKPPKLKMEVPGYRTGEKLPLGKLPGGQFKLPHPMHFQYDSKIIGEYVLGTYHLEPQTQVSQLLSPRVPNAKEFVVEFASNRRAYVSEETNQEIARYYQESRGFKSCFQEGVEKLGNNPSKDKLTYILDNSMRENHLTWQETLGLDKADPVKVSNLQYGPEVAMVIRLVKDQPFDADLMHGAITAVYAYTKDSHPGEGYSPQKLRSAVARWFNALFTFEIYNWLLAS